MSSLAFGFYKLFVSPVIHAITPTQCKFLPSCSEYAYIALSRFGLVRGSWLALRRLLRCHPWSNGGVDPVPGCGAKLQGSLAEIGGTGFDHLP